MERNENSQQGMPALPKFRRFRGQRLFVHLLILILFRNYKIDHGSLSSLYFILLSFYTSIDGNQTFDEYMNVIWFLCFQEYRVSLQEQIRRMKEAESNCNLLIQQAEPTTGKQNHRQVLRNHAIVAITIH
jgi:hypothetical protein